MDYNLFHTRKASFKGNGVKTAPIEGTKVDNLDNPASKQ